MFLGQLVKKPNDTIIIGMATALRHQKSRDRATEDDLQQMPWNDRWYNYIRVYNAEFIAGNIANGISLNLLMKKLGANAFASTKRKKLNNNIHINPRLSIRNQPAVELSDEGINWLSHELENAFRKYGKLPATELDNLYWPTMPTIADVGTTLP